MRPVLREIMEGIRVIRVAHYPSHDRSGIRRFLSYISFAASAVFFGTACVKRPDVIHVYQGPASLMIPATTIACLRGGRIVLDIQDLWPESVAGSGMLRSSLLARLLGEFCSWTYRRASSIVVLSQCFKERLIEMGVPSDKVHVVYNWCDEATLNEAHEEPAQGPIEWMTPGRFCIVYAGSMGPLQGLDAVIDAASILHATLPSVRFVFIGDGVDLSALHQRVKALGLSNVLFVPRQSPRDVARILTLADALLIHLKEGALSRGAIPQKTQAFLAAGRPIIIAVNGEAGFLVEKAGAGVRCRPGDSADIAQAVTRLVGLQPSMRDDMGRRGREFYMQYMSFLSGCDKMEGVFQGVNLLASPIR